MKYRRGDKIKSTEIALKRFVVKKERRGIFLHYGFNNKYPVVLWDSLKTPMQYADIFIKKIHREVSNEPK